MDSDNPQNIFKDRCEKDPQGVIKDLLAQTTRQAQEIHRLGLLTEAVLLPAEATHLIKVLSNQPISVSRDFAAEDLEEALVKKLKIIEDSKEKKEKKKQKRLIENGIS